MSQVGESASQAVTFLRGFFSDVSKLVTAVETGMTDGANLASPWGSGSFWYYSYSYTMPGRWMPRFVARQYVEVIDGAKPNRTAPCYAFFVVHFAPQRLAEPVAVWGLAALDGAQDVWPSFDKLVLPDAGPKFLDRLNVVEWQNIRDAALGVRSMQYQSRAVVELCDETTVDEVVVQPLLMAVANLRQEDRQAAGVATP